MNRRRFLPAIILLILVLAVIPPLLVSSQSDIPDLPDPAYSNVPFIVIGEPQVVSPALPALLDPFTVEDENTGVDQTNQFRASLGLTCLNNDSQLRTAAFNHSQDMHDRNYFAHVAPDPAPNGSTPGDRITNAGYTWNTYGENIAAGRDNPTDTILAWRASRGHYENMINPNFQDIGLGYFDGGAASTSDFRHYWTMNLARKNGGSAGSCPPNPAPVAHIPTNLGASNVNLASPTFTWNQDTTTTATRVPATHFDIEIVNKDTQEVVDKAPSHGEAQEFAVGSVCSGSACTLVYPRTLQNGTYLLYIRAYSASGGYTWSDTNAPFEFTVNIDGGNPTPDPTQEPTPDTSNFDLIAPAGTVNNSHGRPTYQWTDISTASHYEVVVVTKDLSYVNFYGKIDRATYCSGGTCTVNLTEVPSSAIYSGIGWLISNGVYSFYINPAPPTLSNWIGPYDFTIQEAQPNAVTPATTTFPEALKPVVNFSLAGTAQNAAFFQLYVAPILPNDVENSIFGHLQTAWFTREQLCGSWDGVNCSFQHSANLNNNTRYGVYIQSWGPGGFSTGGNIGGLADGWTEITFDIGTPVDNPPPSADEQAVVNLVNAERGTKGLSCLAINPLLTQAAQNHSTDMATRNFFDHFAPDPAPTGTSPSDRVIFVGYTGDTVRENIAVGTNLDAQGAYDLWFNSQGHYENMTASDVNEIGVAKAADSNGDVYWTMVLAHRDGVTCN